MKTKFTQDEWFVVCKRLKPKLRRAEFDRMWGEFQAYKQGYKLGLSVAKSGAR